MFEYELPTERIAQWPVSLERSRHDSKLLYAEPLSDSALGIQIRDYSFSDLAILLRPGDLLVLNDSRVIPCRFFAKHERTNSEVEVLLVSKVSAAGDEGGLRFQALARPMRKLTAGDRLLLSDHILAEVIGRTSDEERVEILLNPRSGDAGKQSLSELILRDGSMPIPPYIRGGRAVEQDRSCYQTVFSKEEGSIAAPTAGLHFTEDLLAKLQSVGVRHCFVTLHVGAASFLPFRGERGPDKEGLPECFSIPESTKEAVSETRERGSRVIAVGTTVVRALESYYGDVEINEIEGVCDFLGREGKSGRVFETKLLIKPGYSFAVVHAMITNFHQPKTSHLLLVSAFIGEREVEAVYRHALDSDYRFLSYGDAMLLERKERRVDRG